MTARLLAAIAFVSATAVLGPAHAEPSVRTDQVRGVDASFTRVDGDRTITGYVTFLREDEVAGAGSAEESHDVGLCVTITNRATKLDVVGPDTTFEDRGCAHDMRPARADGPIAIDATIPTTYITTLYQFRNGHVTSSTPSSVHVHISWVPAGTQNGSCNAGGGGFFVAGDLGVGATWATGGSFAVATGSATSEQLGDAGPPGSACYFSEAYVRTGT